MELGAPMLSRNTQQTATHESSTIFQHQTSRSLPLLQGIPTGEKRRAWISSEGLNVSLNPVDSGAGEKLGETRRNSKLKLSTGEYWRVLDIESESS